MPIDSGFNGLLSVLSLLEPVKTAVAAGVPTLEDLEDVFLDLADDESKVRAMLEHILDKSIVAHHNIRRLMFVFQWFMLNIADPDFQWSNFTRSVYVAHKRAAGLAKQVSSGMAPGEKFSAPSVAASAFDFYVEVLATCQASSCTGCPWNFCFFEAPQAFEVSLCGKHAQGPHETAPFH
jgi:hypothetical protein